MPPVTSANNAYDAAAVLAELSIDPKIKEVIIKETRMYTDLVFAFGEGKDLASCWSKTSWDNCFDPVDIPREVYSKLVKHNAGHFVCYLLHTLPSLIQNWPSKIDISVMVMAKRVLHFCEPYLEVLALSSQAPHVFDTDRSANSIMLVQASISTLQVLRLLTKGNLRSALDAKLKDTGDAKTVEGTVIKLEILIDEFLPDEAAIANLLQALTQANTPLREQAKQTSDLVGSLQKFYNNLHRMYQFVLKFLGERADHSFDFLWLLYFSMPLEMYISAQPILLCAEREVLPLHNLSQELRRTALRQGEVAMDYSKLAEALHQKFTAIDTEKGKAVNAMQDAWRARANAKSHHRL